MPTPILFMFPFSFSLWSLQTSKTFFIQVVAVVSFDFVHSSYMFMLNDCFYNIDQSSSMFA